MHHSKLLCSITIVSGLLLQDCRHTVEVSREELSPETTGIEAVVLQNGDSLSFPSGAGRDSIVTGLLGRDRNGDTTFVSTDNVRELRAHPPARADRDSLISEILLRDGRLVQFELPGGEYDKSRHGVTGRSKGGKKLFWQAYDIIEYRSGKPEVLGVGQYMSLADRPKVAEIWRTDEVLTRFDSTGGRWVEFHDVVVGVSETGQWMAVPEGQIMRAYEDRLDVVATSFLAVAYLGLVVVAAVAGGGLALTH